MASEKSKFVWRKKNPPRAQIIRYFRYESRNKTTRIRAKPWTLQMPFKIYGAVITLKK